LKGIEVLLRVFDNQAMVRQIELFSRKGISASGGRLDTPVQSMETQNLKIDRPIPSSYSTAPVRSRQPERQNFTEAEAAEWLRTSRVTLQRIRRRGEISFSRIGGSRIIYTRQNLNDYVASRERAAF